MRNLLSVKKAQTAGRKEKAEHDQQLHSGVWKAVPEAVWVNAIKGMETPQTCKQSENDKPGPAQHSDGRQRSDREITTDFEWKRPKRSVDHAWHWVMAEQTRDGV